jgi:hypothetical protein
MLLKSRINKDRNIILKNEFRTPHLLLRITIINKRVDELHLSSLLSCHRTHEWGLLRKSPWLGEQESKPRIHAFTKDAVKTAKFLPDAYRPGERYAIHQIRGSRLVGNLRDLLPFRFTIHNAGNDEGGWRSCRRAFRRRKCTSLRRLIETGMVWDGYRVLKGFQGWILLSYAGYVYFDEGG